MDAGRAMRPTGLLTRKSHRHDMSPTSLDHCSPNRLENPTGHQDRQGRGRPTEQGSDHEDDEAVDVDQFAAGHIADPTEHHQCRHHGQQVAQTDPGDRPHRDMEVPLERGEGQGHDARIELAHQRPESDCHHRQPGRTRPFPDSVWTLELVEEEQRPWWSEAVVIHHLASLGLGLQLRKGPERVTRVVLVRRSELTAMDATRVMW